MPRTPPPASEPPYGNGPPSELMDAVVEPLEDDSPRARTEMHVRPLPANATPLDRVAHALAKETWRRDEAIQKIWRECKKLRTAAELIGHEHMNWKVYLFGPPGAGELARLATENVALKETIATLAARVASLEKFNVRAAAIVGLIVALITLTVPAVLRWLAP